MIDWAVNLNRAEVLVVQFQEKYSSNKESLRRKTLYQIPLKKSKIIKYISKKLEIF